MTVRPRILLARLAHLAQTLTQLDRLREMSPSERAADPFHLMAAERGLHVAAEAVFDLGHHLLAGRGHSVPAAYRDIVPELVRVGALDRELGQRLQGMAGLRNILVHDYAEIDPVRVWQALEDHVDDLKAVHTALCRVPELATRE